MASRKKKNQAGGFIIGPILVIAALSALWKNETRFDYHKAGKKTEHAASLNGLETGENFSYTGEMDGELTLPGKYIDTFTGYLIVHRYAEIYCWERDEDDDGDVTWRMTWMSSVESNSRNSGVNQKLQSGRILPRSYQVAELEVVSEMIEFVDSRIGFQPGPLPKTNEGKKLSVEGEYLMLRKGQSSNLGDERISYRAIPVPRVATYFGRFSEGKGVADAAEQKSGMINSIIQNSGILHHLVAGERELALATMKRHIERLKWIVRGIGTFLVVFGFIFFFGAALRFLYAIPVIGRVAELGAFLLSLAIGLPLALITILLGYIAGHPILLAVVGAFLLAGIWAMVRASKRQKETGREIRKELETEYGRSLDSDEMKQLEYREMAGMLASSGNGIGETESKALDRFAKKSGWKKGGRENLLQEVRENPPPLESPETHLKNLIRIAVADHVLTTQEIRSIRDAANLAGYDSEKFRELMVSVSDMAKKAS